MPDRRFRCEEEYFKLCTSPYLTFTLPRASLIIIITLLSLSLSQHYPTLPHSSLSLLQVITVCFPTLSHPRHAVPSSPNKTKQTKPNKRNLPKHRVNNSLTFKIVVSYWAVPYLLGILSSTPESHKTAPRPRALVIGLGGIHPCW